MHIELSDFDILVAIVTGIRITADAQLNALNGK